MLGLTPLTDPTEYMLGLTPLIIHADKASGDLFQYQSRGGADFRKVCEKCGLTEF